VDSKNNRENPLDKRGGQGVAIQGTRGKRKKRVVHKSSLQKGVDPAKKKKKPGRTRRCKKRERLKPEDKRQVSLNVGNRVWAEKKPS